MKIYWIILLLFPVSLWGQYDFETRYFSINATALPEIPEVGEFTLRNASTDAPLIKNLSDFNQINAKNYWQPVDMAGAMAEEEKLKDNGYDTQSLQEKFNKSYGVGQYPQDGSTKVTNRVYKEQRGLDFLDPCPPFGICPRCAPYRIGRGF